MIDSHRYRELLEQESRHWGAVRPDPRNPQIWHDRELFEIFFGNEYRRLIERAAACGPSVLELGCGEGGLAIEVSRLGARVTGIDLSPERIERARARARAQVPENLPVFRVGDLNTIALPAGEFDCVLAHDALHHIFDLDSLCSESRKALRPGGTIIVMDYIGMGRLRKLLAAAMYAVLPTYQPYRAKWQLRKHLRGFLAGERTKRNSLKQDDTRSLHGESPFEEISQESILAALHRYFDSVEQKTFLPFWFYLAPKVRLPQRLRPAAGRWFRKLDDLLVDLRLARGAYFYFEGRSKQ